MAFKAFISNAALAATAPLLLSAATLYGDGICQRQGDRIYLSLKKSEFAPLLTFAGLAAGGLAGWQFWQMAREEKGGDSSVHSIPSPSLTSPETAPLPLNPLVRPPSLDFFKEVFLNPDGTEKAYHASFHGITGDGKTTLAEALLKQFGCEGRDVYLINPKHRVSQPEWSWEPICTDIEEALGTLKELNLLMTDRLKDPSFDEQFTPINYIIIDELDWIVSHHGNKAAKLVRNLLKVSRSANFRVILCGQSAQLKGGHFDSSDFRQTNRFIMGSEAVAFLSNPQLKWDATPYQDTIKQWQREGKRFTFVQPTKGIPFLQLLPHINRTIPDPLIPAPTPSKEPQNDDGLDLTKLYEQSRKHGWLSASKAKSLCWNLRSYSTTQIREIFEELASGGTGYLRGEGDVLEWRIDRVID